MHLPRLFWLLSSLCVAVSAFAADGGYLFVTFNGEKTPLTEQIYFGLSPDGRNWEALNSAQPVLVSPLGEKGVRDPFIIRSRDGKKAWLLATDLSINLNPVWKRAATAGSKSIVIWESTDLVHWSEPRLVKISADDAGCTWAPEAVYDEESGDYLVFWSSANGRDNFAKFRVWAARTKDFVNFGEPFIYIERDFPVIDTSIVRENGVYYRFTKAEHERTIFLETSTRLAGPWTEMPGFSLAGKEGYEGPACFQLAPASAGKPATWCLLLDHFTKGAGYQPFITTDLASGKFEAAPDIKFPFRFRHGTVIPVTADEYARLKSTYPVAAAAPKTFKATGNPLFTDAFTADPAALVHKDTVYLYAGQDEAPNDKHQGYVMNRWLCYSSTDLITWTAHGSPLKPTDFSWAKGAAWASQVIERDGKFYWYAPVDHATIRGMAIGVAVSDSPTGPFKDARGSALITNDMTPDTKIGWGDIDPTVYIEDNGQAWIFWGNTQCYFAKLKANMTELDGPIGRVDLPAYTEAPWIHKHGNLYYLSYATGFPEKIAYATAPSLAGPWTPRGLLSEGAFNSNTIHQAIVTFKGRDYFFYHNGGRQAPETGGSFRRSVCVDYLYYNPDGTIKRIVQTTEGISVPPQSY